jgi:hypothetical protein
MSCLAPSGPTHWEKLLLPLRPKEKDEYSQRIIPAPIYQLARVAVLMLQRFAARRSGLASGLALAVRPAGLAEAPALKGGS